MRLKALFQSGGEGVRDRFGQISGPGFWGVMDDGEGNGSVDVQCWAHAGTEGEDEVGCRDDVPSDRLGVFDTLEEPSSAGDPV